MRREAPLSRRASGVLLHITSLPGGRLGRPAYEFVDWLVDAGQSWWQVLPLNPPDAFGSPYTSSSAFAGWRGLLAKPDAPVSAAEIRQFKARHAYWAADWELYVGDGATADQVRFQREWGALRAYAREHGIHLIGDLPIYVAQDSAETAAHPDLFARDLVAGAAPDVSHPDGQMWGQPVYDWRAMRQEGYRWWVERFRRTIEFVDVARIDHFRGFIAYWAIPRGAASPLEGHWHRGPGAALFEEVERELGHLPLIAEDLGVITPAVERLRDGLGYPGMAILQYHFDPDPHSPHNLANHREHQVVYTGTHDHDTLLGWYRSLPEERRAEVDAQVGSGEAPPWRLIELAFSSRAVVAMVQTQDVLGLGSEARMNMPGTAKGSWKWRLGEGALTPDLARRLRAASEAASRA